MVGGSVKIDISQGRLVMISALCSPKVKGASNTVYFKRMESLQALSPLEGNIDGASLRIYFLPALRYRSRMFAKRFFH